MVHFIIKRNRRTYFGRDKVEEEKRGRKSYDGEVERETDRHENKGGDYQKKDRQESRHEDNFFNETVEKSVNGEFSPERPPEPPPHLQPHDKNRRNQKKKNGFPDGKAEKIPSVGTQHITQPHKGNIGFDIVLRQ
jgi:hypothetical protein